MVSFCLAQAAAIVSAARDNLTEGRFQMFVKCFKGAVSRRLSLKQGSGNGNGQDSQSLIQSNLPVSDRPSETVLKEISGILALF